MMYQGNIMIHAKLQVRRWGNSLGVVIPKDILKEENVGEKDMVDIVIVKKKKISGFGICKGASLYFESEDEHPDIS
jgi:hypothetical protein